MNPDAPGLAQVQSRIVVTCIVLTKDNPKELVDTCASVLSQSAKVSNTDYQLHSWGICELLIIDGSQEPVTVPWLLSQICSSISAQLHNFSLHVLHEFPPSGIYTAMNMGLAHAKGEAIIFMNSGDCFYNTYSLDLLIRSRCDFFLAKGKWPRVVFGQACIIPEARMLPAWLVPDPLVTDISRWLKIFTPNHQAMLVDSNWACQNPFILNAPHSADLTWIRAAFNCNTCYVYIDKPVAQFRLGGVSSRLPDLNTLRLRLNEPSRTRREKYAEIIKFLLYPAQPLYPLLMLMKSRIVGFLS
jgi:hypothetical protein